MSSRFQRSELLRARSFSSTRGRLARTKARSSIEDDFIGGESLSLETGGPSFRVVCERVGWVQQFVLELNPPFALEPQRMGHPSFWWATEALCHVVDFGHAEGAGSSPSHWRSAFHHDQLSSSYTCP